MSISRQNLSVVIVNFKSDRDWTSPGFNLYACRQCPFGNEVLDENGFVQIFDAPDLDYSYIAEHPELKDLVKVKNE